jgi:hypothetical protein
MPASSGPARGSAAVQLLGEILLQMQRLVIGDAIPD